MMTKSVSGLNSKQKSSKSSASKRLKIFEDITSPVGNTPATLAGGESVHETVSSQHQESDVDDDGHSNSSLLGSAAMNREQTSG